MVWKPWWVDVHLVSGDDARKLVDVIPFITVTTFTVLNLFIGIVVDAMATVKESEAEELHQDHDDIETMIAKLHDEVRELRAELKK